VLFHAPEVKRINFNGNTAVGRIVARHAAEHLKPCLLELGGKAPLIVLDDADLDEAVKAAGFGAFMNQSQVCMSTERIIVVDAVADIFAEKLAVKTASTAAGEPRKGNASLGAVVDQTTVRHVNSMIDDATSKGANVIAGGKAKSVVMPAIVVDGVTSAMDLYTDESFGPIVAIIRARDAEHAVALANDSQYGLSAAVFTRDIGLGRAIARRIQSGICHVNGPIIHDEPQMPFGGVGASGHGRFGGRLGIDSFTETRWITIQTQPGHFPICRGGNCSRIPTIPEKPGILGTRYLPPLFDGQLRPRCGRASVGPLRVYRCYRQSKQFDRFLAKLSNGRFAACALETRQAETH